MKGNKLKNCPALVPNGPSQGMNPAKIHYAFWKTASDIARTLPDTQRRPGKDVGCTVHHRSSAPG